MNTTITREDNAAIADMEVVGNGLDAFNLAQAGEYEYTPLRLFARDENGAIAGGLLADVYFRWAFVKILWVDERLRGRGLGVELMRRAEAEARELGCTGIWLDTFSFQAPEFYRKLGYDEFGRLDDYPPGFSRHFFRKMLA
ncbi:MAG TPA: GNAT family N-acetyltransferase [Longimicrobium sp.]|nr:GNAT family N-acetyltransferase [Longimicrobium sp.]